MQKSFHAWTQPGYEPFRFDYDADRIDALAEERAMEWKRVGDASFLTLDEQREAVGYGALPKGASVAGAAPGAPGAPKRVGKAPSLRYSPDQPRVPAGSPQGGQWTSEGGGGDSSPSSDPGGAAPQNQVALNVDPNVASDADSLVEPTGDSDRVDLRDEEGGSHYGHAIRDHVDKNDDNILRRAREKSFEAGPISVTRRAGSFSTLETANKLVNSAIDQNKDIVDRVARGDLGVKRPKRIDAWSFNSPTGKQAYAPSARAQPAIRATWGVTVVLRHDPTSRRGFRVITAFPINRSSSTMQIPDAFNEIASSFHQDTHLWSKTLDEAIAASITEMTPEERKVAKNFLDELLSGKYSDPELAAVWNETRAGSGGFGIAEEPENGAAWFLGKIRSALESSLAAGKAE